MAKEAVTDTRNYGRCYQCRETWATATEHVTDYANGRGCFPFCERCFWSVERSRLITGYWKLGCDWRAGGTWLPPEAMAIIVNAALAERGFEQGWQEDLWWANDGTASE